MILRIRLINRLSLRDFCLTVGSLLTYHINLKYIMMSETQAVSVTACHVQNTAARLYNMGGGQLCRRLVNCGVWSHIKQIENIIRKGALHLTEYHSMCLFILAESYSSDS